jgi:hypothetical protein
MTGEAVYTYLPAFPLGASMTLLLAGEGSTIGYVFSCPSFPTKPGGYPWILSPVTR